MLGEIGKALIIFGLVLVAIGFILTFLPASRLGRLPGDFLIQRRGWSLYIPITTSILISLVLTLLLWIVTSLKK